jgi:hypothetical protein
MRKAALRQAAAIDGTVVEVLRWVESTHPLTVNETFSVGHVETTGKQFEAALRTAMPERRLWPMTDLAPAFQVR